MMKTETTKQRILTEAIKLFAKEGYEAVSVDQIAKAVGIKAPSLYKHYKNKRDIFDSILQVMEQRDGENAAACSPSRCSMNRKMLSKISRLLL